jgi:hypothetical protein
MYRARYKKCLYGYKIVLGEEVQRLYGSIRYNFVPNNNWVFPRIEGALAAELSWLNRLSPSLCPKPDENTSDSAATRRMRPPRAVKFQQSRLANSCVCRFGRWIKCLSIRKQSVERAPDPGLIEHYNNGANKMSGHERWRRAAAAGAIFELQQPPKKPRKKTYLWCRRPNRFSDNPRWRVVSKNTGINLATVIAFVNRLEELGNDAANRGDIRGSVAEFNALEFAAALDIPMEEAKALYACLTHPEVGWIADGVISDFQDRNPDQEDPTATERQRRRRSRNTIRESLDDLVLTGKLSRDQRAEFVSRMAALSHDELVRLQMDIERAAEDVTRDSRLSRRDIVTVTPDQKDQNIKEKVGLITPVSPSGSIVGLAREGTALENTDTNISEWLREEGPQFVVQRMQGTLETATRRLRDWSAQAGERVLFEILQGTKDREGTVFLLQVSDQVRRREAYPALLRLDG